MSSIASRSIVRSLVLSLAVVLTAAACSTEPDGASIELSASTVALSDTAGVRGTATSSVSISGRGSRAITDLAVGTITYGPGASGWLTAALSGPEAPATLTLQSSSDSTLPVGTYTATVPVISGLAGQKLVEVQLTLMTRALAMQLTPNTLAIDDTTGRVFQVVKRNVAITATGRVTGLAAGAITYGAGGTPGWLSVSLSGTEAPATLELVRNYNYLTPGTYTATVPVRANEFATPRNVQVSLTVNAPPRPAPIAGVTVVATGNIGRCGGSLHVASANAVAAINPDYLFLMGDATVPQDTTRDVTTLEDYMACFDPVWGRFKAITYSSVGNHDQDSNGVAAGADAYFGPERVGPTGRNYYSFNVGSWHIIVLNIVSGGKWRPITYNNGSEQLNWLYSDLRANRNKRCTLVFWHDPMWHSSSYTSPTDPNNGYRRQPQRGIWTALYNENADLVLGGGDHIYERFAPMRYEGSYTNPDPEGTEFRADPVRGIRQISTGLGGDGPITTPNVTTIHPLSEYRSGGNGVLKLILGDGVYQWEFINSSTSPSVARIQDWGQGTCH